MIIEKIIEWEINYVDDEYKLFDQSIIDRCNIDSIQIDFYDELKYIKLLQCKYIGLCTSNLAITYDELSLHEHTNISNPTYNCVEKMDEAEGELTELFYRIKWIFDNSLCYMEKVVFIDFFIKRKGRESVKNRLKIGNERFKLVKSSCLIKFALGLQFEDIEK